MTSRLSGHGVKELLQPVLQSLTKVGVIHTHHGDFVFRYLSTYVSTYVCIVHICAQFNSVMCAGTSISMRCNGRAGRRRCVCWEWWPTALTSSLPHVCPKSYPE